MALFKNRSRKSVTLIVAAGLTVAGTGVAFAYWTATGTGEGTATTGAIVGFTIASSPAQGGPLTPGGASETVAFTVTNPSTNVQTLGTVAVAIANADGSPWEAVAGCTSADYAVTVTTAPATGDVAAKASVNGTATVSMNETGLNQDACQGADVPLYFSTAPLVP